MSKLFWQALKVAPAIVGASLVIANSAVAAESSAEADDLSAAEATSQVATPAETTVAQAVEPNTDQTLEQINRYSEELNDTQDSAGQVTSVTQFRDVQPTDWAYEALRGLVERYGCIEGYPDQTYRGNRALTRYEFAAGLYSCLTQIERLIAATGGGLAPEDLERLQRLAQEFEAELATLGARVDNLEGRVAFLEDNQFSTTAQLNAEVIFDASQVFPIEGEDQAFDLNVFGPQGVAVASPVFPGSGDELSDEDIQSGLENAGLEESEIGDTDVQSIAALFNVGDDVDEIDSITTFSYRARLNFDASFTGEDLLRVRLEAGNTPEFDELTNIKATRLGFESTSDGDIALDSLYYTTPVADRFQVFVGANAIDADDIFPTVANPFFESGGSGALSRFGRRNPLVYRQNSDQGFGVGLDLTENVNLTAAYLVNGGSEPIAEEGLFNGNFAAGAQLSFTPTERLNAALTYMYTYEPAGEVFLDGGTSSSFAEQPFGNAGTRAHRLGAQASLQLGERVNVAGWFGYAFSSVDSSDGVESIFEGLDYDDANILTAAVNVAFLDIGKEGSVLGLIAGIPPWNLDIDDAENLNVIGPFDGNEDFDELDDFDDVPLFFEAQYRFPLNDNILITPGAYVVLNPNQNSNNAPVLVGVIRGTFKF